DFDGVLRPGRDADGRDAGGQHRTDDESPEQPAHPAFLLTSDFRTLQRCLRPAAALSRRGLTTGHRLRLDHRDEAACDDRPWATEPGIKGVIVSWITGVGLTPFGRLEGRNTLDLMSGAATAALADAALK